MSNLKVIRNNQILPFKSFPFPAGEISVKLEVKNSVAFTAKTGPFAPADYQTIIARINNSNDIMELLLLTDALRRIDTTPINLFMPYIPYARQDRVCDKGEAFSLKVFANLINSLNFNKVTVIDPHSNVCDGVFNSFEVISQLDLINKWTDLIPVIQGSVVVAPDLGGSKKTAEIAAFVSHDKFIRADKLRDLSNGNIKETIVYCDDLNGKNIFLGDDIIEGGRTFIELAKVLKKKNCGRIVLYATHGIFSQGVDNLLNNGIDQIWVTNSYRTDLVETDRLRIFNIDSLLN